MMSLGRSTKIAVILILLAFSLTISNFIVPQANVSKAQDGDGQGLTLGNIRDDYEVYLSEYKNAPRPQESISISATDFTDANPAVEIVTGLGDAPGESVKTDEEGYIEWKVNIKTAGLYNVKIEYYPVEGRGSSIERELLINGQLPFFAAGHLTFSRVWADGGEVKQDNRGNDIRPTQVEAPRWEQSYFWDYMGYYNEPYYFYFNEGENTIRLVSVKEPMAIKTITIEQAPKSPTYEQVLATYQREGYKNYSGTPIKIQGEDADLKSDPTLYPLNDRASPTTEPYDPSKIRLNTIGGYRWNLPGQWIVWEIDVPEDGLYRLAFKVRQNMVRGSFSNRRLLIDERVPFDEAGDLKFEYKNDWAMYELTKNAQPCLFYLTKGKHEIKLEVTLGDLAEIIRTIESSLYQLNEAYRKIIMVTTPTPDPYRDYQLDLQIPDVIKELDKQGNIIDEMAQQLIAYTGQRGSQSAILYRLSYQLKDMARRPDRIPRMLNDFKTNIGSLGTWILSAREQPLEIDYIWLGSPTEQLPEVGTSLGQKALHEARALIASFTEDYNSVGNVYGGEALKVWIQTGRDQAQVLKQIIDDTFTPQTGVPVNLELVQPGTLLPAVVANIGPDVALQLGISDPVNFATRHAAIDLTQFDEFDEVAKRFHDSALVPYEFNDGVFALPETQSFPMLFYRTDILEELNLQVPQTWQDVFNLLPVIQKNHMDFGIPISTTQTPGAGMTSFTMFLYQMGGKLYKEDGIATALDEEEAIEAFKTWTELYVNYKFPVQYDFANRFRIGEMPIGIADYQTYNFLSVFAPEIRGLWDFAPVPGTEKLDGSIDRSVPSGGTAAMMVRGVKDKNAAWEFLKWWTSTETQERFGREMESLLGAAGRYPTANIEALEKLPWPVKDYKNLMAQWQWVKGNPEVPGGYFTPRHLDNAFREVIYSGEDPRETILDYVRVINDEITNKRIEFGLPTLEDLKDKTGR
ncbi:MAG: hypothetical protein PWP55_1407 [Clostridiales bacterium]|nr:hypothetical protein [Clostridiales bacterium]